MPDTTPNGLSTEAEAIRALRNAHDFIDAQTAYLTTIEDSAATARANCAEMYSIISSQLLMLDPDGLIRNTQPAQPSTEPHT